VTIPVSLKIGYYFSGLANTIQKLSESGIHALVLFNKPYNSDIDINKMAITGVPVETGEHDYLNTLRWMAIMSGNVSCDLAASTGVCNADVAIKQILAGATAFQIASAVYKHGTEIIPQIIQGIGNWMEKHQFKTIDEFRGKLNKTDISDPSAFERVQFMRHYAKIE
jgi:dihydroorotate dehydrogenase (fumarate)